MENYRSEIRSIIENKEEASPQVGREWEQLRTGGTLSETSVLSVGTLMNTRWNQSPYYNDLCPVDRGSSEKTVSGCVATAMVQIMKYWNYPATGAGFHSYNHPTCGTLSANFSTTAYNWAAMPSVLNGSNNAVATLLYQVGVSVNMNYGIASTGGSGAYVISAQSPVQKCSEYALKKHFGYDASVKGVQRKDYTDAAWIQLLKAELDARRPILYAGFGTGGGHAFVCDGYDSNNFFHMNWGWGGAYDGYFAVSALNPSGVGTGGGNGGFNSGHQAVIGIKPPADHNNSTKITLSLYQPVTATPSPLNYGHAFTVKTDLLASAGTGSFKGDFAAAVFDKDYNFVDFVQELKNNDLPAGYHYTDGLTFSSEGLLSHLPGDYYVGIFSRRTGGEWEQVANSGNNTNLIPLKVINPNDIELYKAMMVQGGPVFRKGQALSVTLDVANFGTSTFQGSFDLSLYNLDGDHVQTIETKSNMLMNTNTHYDPALVFAHANVSVAPGTYYLALLHKRNTGDWEITGSTTYSNPIRVIVQEPLVQADQYEPNETQSSAFLLPVSFTGNNAIVVTSGSNNHLGTDKDFYKVVLPPGYTYTIQARLHDSYSAGDGQSYSNDVLFSYLQGSTWSDAYDDLMPSDITVTGGGTLILQVAPYFQGETGTYALDLQITRAGLTGVPDPEGEHPMTLYPNPTKDVLRLDLDPKVRSIQAVRIFDLTGREVLVQEQPALASLQQGLSVQHLAEGTYLLTVETPEGLWRKKFVKTR